MEIGVFVSADKSLKIGRQVFVQTCVGFLSCVAHVFVQFLLVFLFVCVSLSSWRRGV